VRVSKNKSHLQLDFPYFAKHYFRSSAIFTKSCVEDYTGVEVSVGGVSNLWFRSNLNTTALRVEKSQAEQQESAQNTAKLATAYYAYYDKVAL
jgi:hypothetical protein